MFYDVIDEYRILGGMKGAFVDARETFCSFDVL